MEHNQEELFDRGLEIGRFMADYCPATLQTILGCPRDSSGEFLRGLRQARKEIRTTYIEKLSHEGIFSEKQRQRRLKELENIQKEENGKTTVGRSRAD